MDLSGVRYLVVGAGLWGSVLAERIASQWGERVPIIDRRPQAGGNCRSYKDPATGIEVHEHGSHIFHTADARVWEYISGFCEFTSYRHKVLTEYRDRVYPMPISLATINSFYGKNLKPFEVEGVIAGQTNLEPGAGVQANLEEEAVSRVGRPLYEAFIKGYTRKQWGKDPRDLPASIISRLPVRADYNTEYFDDPRQGLPKDGYAALFSRLLDQPRIETAFGTDYASIVDLVPKDCTVLYSGPLDALFGYARGALEWRSLRFELETLPYADFQGTAVMNKADPAEPATRFHEFKHLHPERGRQGRHSVVMREYPKDFTPGDEPYYPMDTPDSRRLLAAYQHDAAGHGNIIAGGRLGSYRYMDMGTTIAEALACFDDLSAARERGL